ncbi:MAG: ShlB/FhaC/HecB family hemolysin secretion/activation protein [Cyanobacteriota bacterium]|nr:ShlB/FhaC/HecB family hemolysin secretion/activation protein [Cyanobacteriota bacterium]
MLPLLAQLVAPPLQPGPVRLPGAGHQRTLPETPRPNVPVPDAAPPTPFAPGPTTPLPRVRGFLPYPPPELARILGDCGATSDPTERLDRCATALRARLFADGYINSRVNTHPDPAPGELEVVAGRIESIQVISSSSRLQRRLLGLLRPLEGGMLHLPSLSNALNELQRLPGVGLLKSNLNRIGEDSSRALLVVRVEPSAPATRGEVSLRNDGNSGSGQFRGLATLVRDGALMPGDTLLLFGELNTDSDPEIGSLEGSLSYVMPLLPSLSLTTALGTSRRHLVEADPPLRGLSTRQLQLFNQLDLTLRESLRDRWTAFAGLSVNRNDAFLYGDRFPVIPGGGDGGWLRTGFLRLGLGYDRLVGSWGLKASVYGLQGIGALSTDAQRQEQRFLGIQADEARAIGSQLSTTWTLAPRWVVDLRAAGQIAFNPLTSPMGFSLGSDNGLRGLPGQVVSGDSGVLGAVDLAWLVWRGPGDALQLVPFLGGGSVWTQVPGARLNDSVGAGGILLRWTRGRHGVLELGWVKQFGSDSRVIWDQWLLGSGVYTKLLYRF